MAYPNELGQILLDSAKQCFYPQWFGSYGVENQDLIKIAKENADGIIYTAMFDANKNDPKLQSYLKNYYKRYKKDSDQFSALAYESLEIVVNALNNCEDTNTDCIKNELYNTNNFQGVTGKLSFDKNGDTEKEVFLKTIKDGKFVLFEDESLK